MVAVPEKFSAASVGSGARVAGTSVGLTAWVSAGAWVLAGAWVATGVLGAPVQALTSMAAAAKGLTKDHSDFLTRIFFLLRSGSRSERTRFLGQPRPRR